VASSNASVNIINLEFNFITAPFSPDLSGIVEGGPALPRTTCLFPRMAYNARLRG